MTCNYITAPILHSVIAGKHILALVRRANMLSIAIFNKELKAEKEIVLLNGSKGFILDASKDKLLLSIDNKLLLIEDSKQRIVLKSKNSKNFFWHATRAENKVFVQEYGEAPTSIFASDNLESWRKLVTNTEIDKHSRHFHNITYDPYRKWLIATLGDGNLTRVAFSEDLGDSWRPLYKGPWQFVPIVPLKDKIVFGMDSGIAKGGLAIYYPDQNEWRFIFLTWKDKNVKYAQFCDLKLLNKDLWVASLGTPYAILSSKDLRSWYPLLVESFDEKFNPHMILSVVENMIACSTGKTLLVFDKEEVENTFTLKPVMVEYKAYWDKLIGYGFLIKHSILAKVR
jgi:hypothetical protein